MSTLTLRLRLIASADFRQGDESQHEDYAKDLDLKVNECVLLVSRNGKLLRFLFRAHDVNTGEGTTPHTILQSRTYRITGNGEWSGLMIQNYAAKVGIKFEGLKLFEQVYQEMQERKRRGKEASLSWMGKERSKAPRKK